jgi:hypothetical protein
MSLLRPDAPRTATQRRLDRTVLVILCCLGTALGLYEAYACSKIAYGYAAGYSFGAAWLLASLLVLSGLPLCVYWRTRWIGVGLVFAGLLSCAAFYGGVGLLVRLDRVTWKHEPPMIAFGPDESASAVVYFCPGTTNEEIENFRENVLEEDAKPRHAGRDFPVFVARYFRLAPPQANGHDAVAMASSQHGTGKRQHYQNGKNHSRRMGPMGHDAEVTHIKHPNQRRT